MSYFNRSKNASPRGIKDGAIEIMRCEDGGFIRVPKPNSRLKLSRLLDQHQEVKNTLDKYKSVDRSIYDKVPAIPRTMNAEKE